MEIAAAICIVGPLVFRFALEWLILGGVKGE